LAAAPPRLETLRQADAPASVLTLPEPLAAIGPEIAAPRPAEPRAAMAEAGTESATAAVTPPSFSAVYLRNPPPRYPLAARRAGEQGTVTLRVLVTREGLPARVDIEKTSGSPHLDSAALKTISTWQFAPARQGGAPVESWVLVPVVFRLEGPT
jgi:protein TonB